MATLRFVQAYCVWPGMTQDVKAVCEACVQCQGNRHNAPKQKLEITDIPHAPFERVRMDLIGPFHPSPQGNKYILTVLDHLTG